MERKPEGWILSCSEVGVASGRGWKSGKLLEVFHQATVARLSLRKLLLDRLKSTLRLTVPFIKSMQTGVDFVFLFRCNLLTFLTLRTAGICLYYHWFFGLKRRSDRGRIDLGPQCWLCVGQ
jgi:hypothetical protein